MLTGRHGSNPDQVSISYLHPLKIHLEVPLSDLHLQLLWQDISLCFDYRKEASQALIDLRLRSEYTGTSFGICTFLAAAYQTETLRYYSTN